MVGTEKVNPDEAEETGAVGTKLKGTVEEETAGVDEVEETDARGMFGKATGVDEAEVSCWVAKEPEKNKKNKSKSLGWISSQFYLVIWNWELLDSNCKQLTRACLHKNP